MDSLLTKMLKFTGRGPYDEPFNPTKGDGWFWQSMIKVHGQAAVNDMYDFVIRTYPEPKAELRW